MNNSFLPKQINMKKVWLCIGLITIIILSILAGKKLGIYKSAYHYQNEIEKQANIIQHEKEIKEVEEQQKLEEEKRKQTLTPEQLSNVENIYHSEQKRIFLTFDDGPSKTVTPLILDLLKQENIKATFFVLGSRVERNPDLVKRTYEEGHYIANHGYSHVYSSIYSSPEAVLEEYTATNNLIKNAIGSEEYSSKIFRFPGGSVGGYYADIKSQAKEQLKQNGIAYLDWNALSQDAAGAKTKEQLIQNTIQTIGTKNSVVILMHDASDKILTYETLPDIIQYLKQNGYTFMNLYDIL